MIYYKSIRFFSFLLSAFFLFALFTKGNAQTVNVIPFADELPFDNLWINDGDTLEQATEIHNINVWKVEDYELATMYNDPYVLRRSDNTLEAWIVFELPYIESLEVLGYFWPEHENTFSIYISSDGKIWEETDPLITRLPDMEEQNRWTKKTYQLFNLDQFTYVKIVWPEVEAASNDWWNPYLGSISAEIGQPRPNTIVAEFAEDMQIPRYDADSVVLTGFVADQLGNHMTDYPVSWEAQQPLPDGIQLNTDGVLTIDSICEDETVLRVTGIAEVPEFEQQLVSIDQPDMQGITVWKWIPTGQMVTMEIQKEIVFHAALLGDADGNLKLDQADLDFVCQHYGAKSTDDGWNKIRLADIDANQKIDIIDVVYLAKFCQTEQPAALPEESEEETPNQTEDKTESEGDSIGE